MPIHTGFDTKPGTAESALVRRGHALLAAALASGKRVVNVGALGRPANDGRTCVWYAFLDTEAAELFQFVPVDYDHARLAGEMRDEKLPEEFVETILSGHWTTCLEVLPARERVRGRF